MIKTAIYLNKVFYRTRLTQTLKAILMGLRIASAKHLKVLITLNLITVREILHCSHVQFLLNLKEYVGKKVQKYIVFLWSKMAFFLPLL